MVGNAPRKLSQQRAGSVVKAGIWAAGGTPVEFHTIAVCDAIAQGLGMHYSLPSRELVAAEIELMVGAGGFDELVMLPSCDKSPVGMLMAAARLNIPTINYCLPVLCCRTDTVKNIWLCRI